MININGIELLDSWDGSKENVTVVVSPPQRTYASAPVLPIDIYPESYESYAIALFREDRAISKPYALIAYESQRDEKLNALFEDLKRVFGPDLKIVIQ
jgi:hypothetical protein